MNLLKLKKAVDKAYKKYGDIEVVIDVEARCFNYHFVGIEHLTADKSEGINIFIITPDYYNAPPNIYDNDLNDIEGELNE